MTSSTLPVAYATVEELRQVLDIPPGQEQNDVDLQRAIDAATAWIDWFTGRTFGRSAADVAKVLTAVSESVVPLVDLSSTAPTVEVDTDGDRTFATTLVPDQYQLTPTSGPPFSQLRAWPYPPEGTDPVVFVEGELVRVTGQWGSVDARGRLPANVNEACLLLGARWFKRRETPMGVLSQPELDVFARLTDRDPDVHALLFPLCVPGSPGAGLLASTLPAAAVPGGAALWVMV